MNVAKLISILQRAPSDWEVVICGDYPGCPDTEIISYNIDRDLDTVFITVSEYDVQSPGGYSSVSTPPWDEVDNSPEISPAKAQTWDIHQPKPIAWPK